MPTYTWGGIQPGWVEPAYQIELNTSRVEALQARRSCASSQEPFTQVFLHLKHRKTFVQSFSNLFLKTLTEGSVTTEDGSLFQYFTTLTENANPLLRRWLASWSTVKGCPLRTRRSGGRKNKFRSISEKPLSILKVVIRSARSRCCRK